MVSTNDYQYIVDAIQRSVTKAVSDAKTEAEAAVVDPASIQGIETLDSSLTNASNSLLYNSYFESDPAFKVTPHGWAVSNGYATVLPFATLPTLESAEYVGATSYGPPVVGEDTAVVSPHSIKIVDRAYKWYYVDDSSSALTSAGSWTRLSSDNSYSGAHMRCGSLGSYASSTSATLTFRGTGVRYYSPKNDSGGNVSVYLDGVLINTFELYNSTTLFKQKIYESSTLEDGDHTLVIVPQNGHHASSDGYYVWLDCFQVKAPVDTATSGTSATVIRAESNGFGEYYAIPSVDSLLEHPSDSSYFALLQPTITNVWTSTDNSGASFTGTWATNSNASHYGGSIRSASAAASATITFTGVGIKVYAHKASSYGKANVYLDGELVFTADYYSAQSNQYQQKVFEIQGLALEEHTVVVAYSGNKNADSTGYTVNIDYFKVQTQTVTEEPFSIYQEIDKGVLTPGKLYQLNLRAAFFDGYIDAEKFIASGASGEPDNYIRLDGQYATNSESAYFLPVYSQESSESTLVFVKLLFKDANGLAIDELVSEPLVLIEGTGFFSSLLAFRVPDGAETATLELESDPPDDYPFAVALDHLALFAVDEGRQTSVTDSDFNDEMSTSDVTYGLPDDGSSSEVSPAQTPGPPSFITVSGSYEGTAFPYGMPILATVTWGSPTYDADQLMQYEITISDEGEPNQQYEKPRSALTTQQQYMFGNLFSNHSYFIQVSSIGFDGTKSTPITTGFYYTVEALPDVSGTLSLTSPSPQQLLASWSRLDRSDVIGYTLAAEHSVEAYSSAATATWGTTGVTSAWVSYSVMQTASGINPVYYVPASGDFWWRVAVKAVTVNGELSTNWLYSTSSGVHPSQIDVSSAAVVPDIDLNQEFIDEIGDDRIELLPDQGMISSSGGFYYYSDAGPTSLGGTEPREPKATAFRGFVTSASTYASSPIERAFTWYGLMGAYEMYPAVSGALRMGMFDTGARIEAIASDGSRAFLGQSGAYWGLLVENGKVVISTVSGAVGLTSAGLIGNYPDSYFQMTSAGISYRGFTTGATSGTLDMGIFSGNPQIKITSSGGYKALLGKATDQTGADFWGLYIENGQVYIKTAEDRVQMTSTGLSGSGTDGSSFNLDSSGIAITTTGGSINLRGSGLTGSGAGTRFSLDSNGFALITQSGATNSFISLNSAGLVGQVGGQTRFQLTSGGLTLNSANVNLTNGGYIQLSGVVAGNGMVINNNGLSITSGGSSRLQVGAVSFTSAGVPVSGYGIYSPAGSNGIVHIESGHIHGSTISGGNIYGAYISGANIVGLEVSASAIVGLEVSASDLTAGTISGSISLQIGNKTSLTSTGEGFFMNSSGEFKTGAAGDSSYMKYSGGNLVISGAAMSGSSIRAGSISGTSISGGSMLLSGSNYHMKVENDTTWGGRIQWYTSGGNVVASMRSDTIEGTATGESKMVLEGSDRIWLTSNNSISLLTNYSSGSVYIQNALRIRDADGGTGTIRDSMFVDIRPKISFDNQGGIDYTHPGKLRLYDYNGEDNCAIWFGTDDYLYFRNSNGKEVRLNLNAGANQARVDIVADTW